MSKFLIVGLGNIGEEYAETRHNIGFKVVDHLAAEAGITFSSDRYADVAHLKHKGKQLILIKPTTYMNLSGKAVNYWLQSEKIDLENIMVLVDELALPFGKIRIGPKGSDGGHNGLKSIEGVLLTQEYGRLRMGVGSDFAKGRQADFVLSNFNEDEIGLIPFILNRSNEIIDCFCLEGIQQTMNKYNQ